MNIKQVADELGVEEGTLKLCHRDTKLYRAVPNPDHPTARDATMPQIVAWLVDDTWVTKNPFA